MNTSENRAYSIPQGLEVLEGGLGESVIRRSWRTWQAVPILFFVIFWNGFLCFWYWKAFTMPRFQWSMVLFPLIHVAVGAGLTYYVIASFVNRTDVILRSAGVKVVTAPLPWLGNCVVNREDLTAVLVRKRYGNKGRVYFQLLYVDRARREQTLVRSVSLEEQANFIAQRVRQYFNVPAGED